MDRDPSGSRGAEVIDITPYINGETPRDIGKVVYASFSRGGSKQKEGLGSSEKAPVYDIFSGTTQEDRLREQLDDAIQQIKALPEQQKDVNAYLEQIDKSLDNIYQDLADDQKLKLAAQLTYALSRCHENVSRVAIPYPNLLKIIGVAAKLRTNRHPAAQASQSIALYILSLMPGAHDLENGTYTPPEQ